MAEKTFFEFKNSADGIAPAELLVYDEIIPYESWWFDMPNPQSFMAQLRNLGDVAKIKVRINSPGGDLLAAQCIYTQLRNHKAEVTTYVEGIALSAASVVAMAGKCVMAMNSMMMIHNPLLNVTGDHRDMDQAKDVILKARETLLAVYQDKTGLAKEELITMLDNETWLAAAEANTLGFCDEVDTFASVAACVKDAQVIVNGRSFSMSNFKTIPAALFAGGKEVKSMSNEAETTKTDQEVAAAAAAAETETAAAAAATETGGGETSTEQDPTVAIVNAERTRIKGLMALNRAGAEKIINDAIESGANVADTALAICNSQAVSNAAALGAKRADAPQIGASAAEETAKAKGVSLLAAARKRLMGQ